MKTASFKSPFIPAQAGTYPIHHLIDLAPFAARYEVMTMAMLALLEAGRLKDVLRITHKVTRLIRTLTKLDTHNIHVKRKLEMLSHKPWRDLVLKELGGMRKLKLWEAAQKRIMQRIEARKGQPIKDMPPQEPAWLYTPERIAESEQLKAHAQRCAKACAPKRVFRDRCKMDFDGEFRLAPLPRSERAPRQMSVYTKNTIIDYEYNAIPFGMESAFGPAMVWPSEFYAAMKVESEILETPTLRPCIPAQRLSSQTTRAGSQSPQSGNRVPNQVWDARRLKGISLLPLTQALSPKVYRDIFGSLLS